MPSRKSLLSLEELLAFMIRMLADVQQQSDAP
jgi:hypothetical protein